MELFGSHILNSFSATQQVRSLSSGEAEYYAMTVLAGHGLFTKNILECLKIKVIVHLKGDSSAARGIASRQGVGKIRHMQVRFLWLQDEVKERRIKLGTEKSEENVADLGTKALEKDKLRYLMGRLQYGAPWDGGGALQQLTSFLFLGFLTRMEEPSRSASIYLYVVATVSALPIGIREAMEVAQGMNALREILEGAGEISLQHFMMVIGALLRMAVSFWAAVGLWQWYQHGLGLRVVEHVEIPEQTRVEVMTDAQHGSSVMSTATAEELAVARPQVTVHETMPIWSEYYYKTVKQLQEDCRSKKLPTSGLKQNLIDRLERFDQIEDPSTQSQKKYMNVLRAKTGIEPTEGEWTFKSLASAYIDQVKRQN